MNVNTITPQELYDRIQRGESVDLVDVRTPVEYREIHVAAARNIPLDRLDPMAFKSHGAETSKPLYVVCRSGSRGKQAYEKLVGAGLTNVINVEGGTVAWDQAGLPVIRGKRAISLERQVRIAAGFLVLLGSTLGYFVHPYWFGLSAFVGAGLMFAGITDTCGMAMILAKMPWNQVADAPTSPSQRTVEAACDAGNSGESTSCCG